MHTLSDYEYFIESLFLRRPRKAAEPELMDKLLAEFGDPHKTYPIIHVAGTNGKGQVAAKIAFALQCSGYQVGQFISPHLFEYEERISIGGMKVPKQTLIEYDRELMASAKKYELQPNFFECTCCYGFRYFAEKGIDVAVIEAGIGGRFDATNVADPVLSVLTSVSYDHMNYLGKTLEDIAWQKAGIIKRGVPVIVGPRAKYAPIFKEAEDKGSPCHVVEKESCFYDTENQATARLALEVLSEKFPVDARSAELGLKHSLPCRFDKRGNCIYDVAHNPDGFKRLIGALEHLYPYKTFRFLIGMSQTKDIAGCLKVIERKAHHVHFVQAKRDDSVDPKLLASTFQSLSTCPFSVEESVETGMKHAKELAGKKEILVVCGSFFIMKEAL